MSLYQKANNAAAFDSGGCQINDGWAVWKAIYDESHDLIDIDLIAVVHTETLADFLIAALDAEDSEESTGV